MIAELVTGETSPALVFSWQCGRECKRSRESGFGKITFVAASFADALRALYRHFDGSGDNHFSFITAHLPDGTKKHFRWRLDLPPTQLDYELFLDEQNWV